MLILQVSQSAYPPLTGLKRNYNDAETRVRWRSKQVADFAFMFYYGRTLSEYYVQIEDDVICAPRFVSIIKEFINQQKEPWVILEFSSLGFIGERERKEGGSPQLIPNRWKNTFVMFWL